MIPVVSKPITDGTDKISRRSSKKGSSKRPIWMEKPSRFVTILKAVVIALIVVIMVYPLVGVVLSSFASPSATLQLGLWPTDLTLSAYKSVLQGGIVTRAMIISIFITIIGTVLSTLATATLAYGLTRTKQAPGLRAVLYIILLTMLFNAGIIPNFLLVKQLGLVDTYAALILPTLISVFNMVVVRNFFMQLPEDLLDAARIDGASEFRVFWWLVIPLSKPVLAVISLFYAVSYWNSFFNALLYLNKPQMWPIQLVLNQYVLQGSPLSPMENPDVGATAPQAVQMAVVVIATVPIVILYPFLQRYFTKGVLTGAIKG